MIAPSMTPTGSSPDSEHANERDRGHDEFGTIPAPELFERRELEQTGHRHQHDGGQHRLRQGGQQMRKEKYHYQNDAGCDGA